MIMRGMVVDKKIHPRKLTAGGPQNYCLEKVTPALNMAIFDIFVKFLGCHGILTEIFVGVDIMKLT